MTSTGLKITDWVKPDDASGEFKRQVSTFRDSVSRAAGARYPPQKGRYHLYVSIACNCQCLLRAMKPWLIWGSTDGRTPTRAQAHRTLIACRLKGLEGVISYSVVHWHLGEGGWRFVTPEEVQQQSVPGANVVPDPVAGHEGFTHLPHVYLESEPAYDGRYTVPVLYDKQSKRIVNNESSEILRMLGSEFDDLLDDAHRAVVLYPEKLCAQIDEANIWMYDLINNGVYKSGFATTAEAYEKNVRALFAALDRAKQHLVAQQEKRPYYFGDSLTEVDIRLFVTLIRFDAVYVQHFKCNVRDIRSGYPALHRWIRHLYWNEAAAFGATTQFDHIRWSYTRSHTQINPAAIAPLGPLPNILPLDREVPAVEAARPA